MGERESFVHSKQPIVAGLGTTPTRVVAAASTADDDKEAFDTMWLGSNVVNTVERDDNDRE
jgi:hypothetical protein